MRNILKKTITVSILFSALMTSRSLMADAPVIVWTSVPVNPGEAVMVYGGPWKEVKEIELSGPEDLKVKPLLVTDDCVTFVYPETWPLIAFNAKIVDSAGSAEVRINAPDVWWLQGNAGKSASPGGWLRVFGRCIGYNNKAFLEFKANGKTIKLPADEYDLYSLRVELPRDFSAGDYDVFLNNGLDKSSVSAGKFSIAPHKEPWPEKIFNVVDYGAVPNDCNDDSHAILNALADIGGNGGGILYFPRGRFGMRGEIELPPNTLLRGEGMALSQIYWPDQDYPEASLISGKYNFGIEEIFLVAGNINCGIQATPPKAEATWTNRNILLRRVRVRFLHTDTMSKEETLRRSQGGEMFTIKGDFIRIIDCDLYSSKGSSYLHGDYCYIKGNRFSGPSCSYIGGRNFIFENNNSEGRSISFGNGSRCCFFKDNKFGAIYGDGDRETFTNDGGAESMNGREGIISATGKKLRLKSANWRNGSETWIDRAIYIVGGKGAGQVRYITKIDGDNVEINRPWDIQPDATSYFTIALTRYRLLFIENHTCDGNPFSLYGSAIDVVFSGNQYERNSGISVHGMTKGGGTLEPSWFVQFFDNEILEGNSVRGPSSSTVPAADAHLGFYGRGTRKPLTFPLNRSGVMRRNALHNNAHIASNRNVKNILIENNVVNNADVGIILGGAKDAVLRGNRFKNVIQPHQIDDYAMVDPMESTLAALQAPESILKKYLPENWSEYAAAVEALGKKAMPENERLRAFSEILKEAVKALSAKVGNNPIPSKTVAVMLGLDLSQKSYWTFEHIGSGRLERQKSYIVSNYPSWSPPANLSAKTKGLKNWKVSVDFPKKLIPGKKVDGKIWFSRPDKIPTPFTLPIEYEISGDGWKFRFEEKYAWDYLNVTDYLVMGPFKNKSGKLIDTEVHPPEIHLDVNQSYSTIEGKRIWVPIKTDKTGKADLRSIFKKTDLATAHAIAIVRTSKQTQVKISFEPLASSLAFVNGKRIGSSGRRDFQGHTVNLKKGDNLLHLISSNKSGNWPIRFHLNTVDPVQPGDIEIVKAEDIPKSPIWMSQGGKIPEGKDLKNNMGIDWKLVFSDTFSRLRLGGIWKGVAIGYMSQSLGIVDGAMKSEASYAFLAYDRPVKPPVRIEFDMLGKGCMAGVFLCPDGLVWRTFWATLVGRGYCFSLGWHNDRNNRIMRDTETVLLDTKLPPLKEGKWYHVTAQFVPPHCQIYVDDKLILDYQDPKFLPGLDRIGVFKIGEQIFDNVRIYEGTVK